MRVKISMQIAVIMTWIVTGVTSGCANERLLSDFAYLLSVGMNSSYVVYFQPDDKRPEDYAMGQVYIYDVKNKTSNSLNSLKYCINFLKVHWSNDGETFLVSDGDSVECFTFSGNRKYTIYRTKEHEAILNIAISRDSRFIALNTKCIGKDIDTQKVVLGQIDSLPQFEVVYFGYDESIGEFLTIDMLFEEAGHFLLIRDLAGNLMKCSINSPKSIVKIDSIAQLLYADSNSVYYTKSINLHNTLLKVDLVELTKHVIMQSGKDDIRFIGLYDGRLSLNLSGNIMQFDKQGTYRGRMNMPVENYIYLSDRIAIFERNRGLYLHEF